MVEKFFKDPRLPFAECRFSRSSKKQFKPHIHKSFSVGAVEYGEVEYTVGEERALLTIGSLAVINPETLHSCNCLDERGRSFYMLYLDLDWCHQIQECLWQVDSFIPSPLLRLDDYELYRQYCEIMEHVMNPGMDLLEKDQLLHELVATIFRQIYLNITAVPPDWVSKNIVKMKELLGSNLKDELTLESLAKSLGANPYTLLRKFKAITGVTPHAYRTNCRIEHSKRLLQEGMDIAEVALDCGFFDQSHLHRHFKAMTAVTPQQYRVNFIQ